MASLNYSSLAVDLGDVLLLYSTRNIIGLSSRRIKNVLESPSWHDYERGEVSQQDCFNAVTETFGLTMGSWRQAMMQMTEGLQPNTELIAAIRKLKARYPSLRVHCLSNIPEPEFEHLKRAIDVWGIFDGFYTSSMLRCRKPDTAFYKSFLEKSKEVAESCIFVDDRLENITTAISLGFRAVLFEDTKSVITTLCNLLGDPVARGMAYLHKNAKNLFCETSTGEVQRDNYSQILILQNTGNRSLVTLEKRGPTWNYFIGEPVFADTVYPDDVDTTSLAMIVLEDIPMEEKELAMRLMVSNLSPDGLPYSWFDKSRPRLCHCVCANVYRFFYLHNHGEKLSTVYDYLCRLLRTKAYLLGARYYESPDWFLYFLTDLCAKCPSDPALQGMRHLLVLRLQDRMGSDTNILNAAMRLLSSQALRIANQRDLDTILNAQQLDGGWEQAWLWRYGKETVKVGSRGVVTAMAVKGIRIARESEMLGRNKL